MIIQKVYWRKVRPIMLKVLVLINKNVICPGE